MGRKRESGGRRRSPLLFGITFRAILIVAAAAMLLSYIAVYVNPAKFALPLFFGLYFIPILAINLLLLLIALIRRSASAWIAVAALLPALLYTDLFVKIGNREEPQKEGIEIKIATWNVGMFSSSSGRTSGGTGKTAGTSVRLTREECRREIGKFIAGENPHILCLQEFFAEDYTQADTLYGQYPYRHYHLFKARNGKLFGNMILSKFPIAEKGVLSFRGSTNLSIFADVEHYGRTLRIYNNHLESYDVSFTALAHKFYDKLNEMRKGEGNVSPVKEESLGGDITRDIVETHGKMKDTFIKRSEQVARILDDINRNPHQTIICGDFNDTPMSYTYHTLAKNRKDTFREAGSGFGATFIPVWPLLRIDYLLVPAAAECTNHTIHKESHSDHYPVTCSVIL